MIIDFHAHWWPSNEYVHSREAWTKTIQGINQSFYMPAGLEYTNEGLEKLYFDLDGSALLKQMAESGIDRTVILPLDWGQTNGKPALDIIEQNRAYADLSQKYPDKIISFFSNDPKNPDAARYFETAITQWGMQGLKLYPPTGFFPDDDICTPLYEICREHVLPVVFHGTTSPMSEIPYCAPEGFVRLADKFPEMPFVIAHAGGMEWHTQALEACQHYENIYLDISGLQAVGDADIFKALIEGIYTALGSFEQVLFGTDNPIFKGMCHAKDMVAYLKEMNVPEREVSNILGNTARKLLGL